MVLPGEPGMEVYFYGYRLLFTFTSFPVILAAYNPKEFCHQRDIGCSENDGGDQEGDFLFLPGDGKTDHDADGTQAEFNQRQILPVRFFYILIGTAEQTFHTETSFIQ